MKRTGLGVVVLLLTIGVLAGTATMASAAKFSVIGEERGEGHGDRNSFVFHEKLTQDGIHVGKLRAEITRAGQGAFAAKGLFRFHGGKIRIAGVVEPAKRFTLPITGGKGRYHGISGKVRVKDLDDGFSKYTFKYSR